MRSAELLALSLLVSGCTSVLVPRVEHPPPADPEPAPEPALQLSIGRVALSIAGEPTMVLEDDGRLVHATCEGRLDEHGVVRDRDGGTTLQLAPSGAVVDGDGREIFTIEGASLRRVSGSAAQLADGRVTFEGSPELALDVERAEGVEDRVVLLVVAALSMCEP